MKARNDLLSGLLDTMLAALMAFAGVACLTTGFRMDADLQTVAITAAIFAVIASCLARIKYGWLGFLPIIGLGGLLLHELGLETNLGSALHHILILYNRGYGWGIPEFLTECEEWDLTLTMQTLAACGSLAASWHLNRRFHIAAALTVILPLAPTMVITDTVPDTVWLLIAIGTLALLAMTHLARLRNTKQANRLVALLLIPLMLWGTLLFTQIPADEYEPPDPSEGMFSLMEKLADLFPFLNLTPGGPAVGGPTVSDTVNLTGLGPRPQEGKAQLSVIASESGMLYLRGRSYTDYTGISWLALEGTEVMTIPDDFLLEGQAQTLQIITRTTTESENALQYFPYYPQNYLTLEGGGSFGPTDAGYRFSYRPLKDNWYNLFRGVHGVITTDHPAYAQLQQYLQLPDGLADALQVYLKRAGNTANQDVYIIARQIEKYVRDSAAYNLNTGYMPTYADDFVLWFLEYGNTGYCVHFASTAVALLRAAGIPARYVEGYLVTTQAGHAVEVTGSQAHAWAEYYLPGAGWVVLEATPDDGLPLPPQPPTTQPPTTLPPTQPPTTLPPTQPPTKPTDPTDPTIPTIPTIPTDPTTPTIPTTPTTPTTPTIPTEPTVPPTSIPTEDPAEPMDLGWLRDLLMWVCLGLGLLGLLLGQREARIHIRNKAMNGKTWKQVYRRWQYTKLLCRLCRREPPQFLLELLKKAKFSRNGLDDADILVFRRYCDACIRGLKKTSLPVRLFCRLVLAAW